MPDREDDAERSAREAGLRYVSDAEPGIRRRRCGRGFRYVTAGGRTLTDRQRLAQIRSLAVPPAWTDVWICTSSSGHLQATGRDARGRKQYRYHPRWRDVRDESKYDRLVEFGHALSRIRRRVDRDMRSGRVLARERLLATVIRLLDTTALRIGNDEYARSNGSYGLTTIARRHVSVNGTRVALRFRGKGGKMHEVEVSDPAVARVVQRCQELPGQQLLQYVDEDGSVVDVTSGDVNDHLQEITGQAFTAKDFRTWSGTVMAAEALARAVELEPDMPAKRREQAAVGAVAHELGNTPAVCRRCYIHPGVLEAHLDGTLLPALARAADGRRPRGLSRLSSEEIGVLALLEG